MRERVAPLLLAALALAGCRGMTSTRPPIHVNPNMDHQPKARPQSESDFFYDGASMRPPVPGTVARGELREDPAFFEGKDAAGNDLAHSPVETTPELMRRSAPVYGPLVEEGSREMATYSLDELEVILDFLERNRRLLAKHTARIHELIAEREAGASKTG